MNYVLPRGAAEFLHSRIQNSGHIAETRIPDTQTFPPHTSQVRILSICSRIRSTTAEFWNIQSATRTHYRLSHIHSYATEICREVYASGRTTHRTNCPAEFWDIQSATRTHYRLSHIHSYATEICREVYASGRTTHRILTHQQNSGTYNLQHEHTTGSAIYILMQQKSAEKSMRPAELHTEF